MSELVHLGQIAIRNLFSNFLNFIIGGIIFVGTLLFVVGGSLLNSVDSAMSRSIVSSLAGHIQIYSDHSKDKLSLLGQWSVPDLGVIPNFDQVRTLLSQSQNIQAIVPMGINGASLTHGNTLDVALEKLRHLIKEKNPDPGKVASLKSHVRHIVGVIQEGYQRLASLSGGATEKEGLETLRKANSPEFWASFDKDPLPHLEFLENKAAGLLPDSDLIYLGFTGTDLDAFARSFDRMKIVDGAMVPSGHRGFLLAKFNYEKQFKLKTAFRMDKIHEAIHDEDKKLERDPDLQLLLKQNRTQTREILLQLDPLSLGSMRQRLQTYLKSSENEVGKLLEIFFAQGLSSEAFEQRYQFFYAQLAPLLELYRLKIGDTLTIKTFTKNGFIQSANVKVYGTFEFKGLEKSGLAGGISLVDMMTFRDLYGYLTSEKIEEMEKIKESSGANFVARDQAEAELFGGSSIVPEKPKATVHLAKNEVFTHVKPSQTFSQKDLDEGMILNAAVILKDPTRINETMAEIQKISTEHHLDLRVATWQEAAGNLGQFVFVAKMVLYFAVFIIFIVALVIINSAIMMATLQRVQEIGTMRAIGAQRGFVLGLVLIETLLLGLVFGILGTFTGSLGVLWLGHRGIPAVNDFMYFFFSGPRLHATLHWGSVSGALAVIGGVSCLSALYPAIVATRISPLQAMQTEE